MTAGCHSITTWRSQSTAPAPVMAKIRRSNIPPVLFQHLLDRIQSRKISADQLKLFVRWLDTEPEGPEGEWYKRFSGFTVCGEGELVRTFLLPGQRPAGKEVGGAPAVHWRAATLRMRKSSA